MNALFTQMYWFLGGLCPQGMSRAVLGAALGVQRARTPTLSPFLAPPPRPYLHSVTPSVSSPSNPARPSRRQRSCLWGDRVRGGRQRNVNRLRDALGLGPPFLWRVLSSHRPRGAQCLPQDFCAHVGGRGAGDAEPGQRSWAAGGCGQPSMATLLGLELGGTEVQDSSSREGC